MLHAFRRSRIGVRIAALVLIAVFGGLVVARPAFASDCLRTSTGLTPMNDLGTKSYRGYQGGLYTGGSNVPPSAHAARGKSLADDVTPRNKDGIPDPRGRIVFLSIGMSNTRSEFSRFVALAQGDSQKRPAVVAVNGAQSGASSDKIRDPASSYWTAVDTALAGSNVSRAQVQAVWLKEARPRPTEGFPSYARQLQDDLRAIVKILKNRFANLWLVYVSSRIYAGYATSTLNPEPYAYESAYAVKWLIEDQIAGRLPIGASSAPWLGWASYLWADGLRPRSDGLVWRCADFSSDGTHPSAGGIQKVADLLLDFVHSDPTARTWYVGGGA